jgi:uncharacterized protein
VLSKLDIEQVVASQWERLQKLDSGLLRQWPQAVFLDSHALIITGIRRCGKSTLMQQIMKAGNKQALYLNFEDPRLSGFDASDFNRLHEMAVERKVDTFYFDEIQNTSGWEGFVRFRLDEGFRIIITGSNASMLSRELGTRLTGRHISSELFPFSYKEFLAFTGMQPGAESVSSYLKQGGFPEMLKSGLPDVLMHLFNDILMRDIAVRHNIKNTLTLQQLAVWMVSNTGKPVSGNSLRKMFSIGSSASIMDYLSFFSDAYLFFYVPKFSFSQKVSMVNPKKVYAIDTGLANVNSLSFSDDLGRNLENMVFLELRRKSHEIFYFSEERECDFVVASKGKPIALFQVCLQLDQNNLNPELNGLQNAMDSLHIPQGTIITLDQSDTFSIDNKTIKAIPFHQWAGQGISD